MTEFTQKEITELGKIAESTAKSLLPKKTYFLGIEGNHAVFGVRFIATGKVGLPVFVKISKDGTAEVVIDRDEKFRLFDILCKQS